MLHLDRSDTHFGGEIELQESGNRARSRNVNLAKFYYEKICSRQPRRWRDSLSLRLLPNWPC